MRNGVGSSFEIKQKETLLKRAAFFTSSMFFCFSTHCVQDKRSFTEVVTWSDLEVFVDFEDRLSTQDIAAATKHVVGLEVEFLAVLLCIQDGEARDAVWSNPLT